MAGKRRERIDQKLADSFKELASHKSVERITIKEITDKAGVIRPTFYNHFEDKYHLLAWIVDQELIKPIIPPIQNGQFSEAMTQLFYIMQEEKAFYMHAAKMEGQNSFRELIESRIRDALRQGIDEKIAEKNPENPWMTPQHLAGFYAQGVSYILLTWIESGMEISPEKLAELYLFLITRSLKDVLADMN